MAQPQIQTTAEKNPSPRRWWILGTLLIGTLFGTVNNNIANIALPSLLDDFHQNVGSGVWVITGYVLAFAVFMPVSGRIGDMIGHRRIYMACLVSCTILGVACSFAPSIEALIVLRFLQGASAAPVLPAVMSIVAQAFPASERGRAMSFWATINGAGMALGPTIGGFLTSAFGWRSVFIAVTPIAIIGFFLAWKMVPVDTHSNRQRFDSVGVVALVATALCLMYSITSSGERGLASPVTLSLVVVGLICLALFIITERRIKPPFVDLSLFRIGPYVAVTAVAALQMICLQGTILLIPLLFVRLYARDTTEAGVLLFFLPITMVLMANVAGRINDRYGSRKPIMAGLAITFVAAAGLAFAENLQGEVVSVSSLIGIAMTPSFASNVTIAAMLIIMGLGFSLIQSPAAAAVTYPIEPQRIGVAVGFFNMFRFVGSALATTVFALVLQTVTQVAQVDGTRTPSEALAFAFDFSFVLMMVLAAIGILIATRVRNRRQVVVTAGG